ncbi:hypothetical protein COT52_00705 [candidate division WWE3 bacterium CG08_land_8_20_14_0_20_43_13]|uniref:Uncharacterized protein n=1 Tax=candidate division WWE3 bacterium CG08_land_8_20_14_0_20_43_13 TaxID=1975087 RepID=A0A2H0X7V9_UNCKA|nr:MAG: hypothetical protein COT52_00705 [candidate division WWE3 bacterium CG08_land_8_20_14_0_20_43_13]
MTQRQLVILSPAKAGRKDSIWKLKGITEEDSSVAIRSFRMTEGMGFFPPLCPGFKIMWKC